MSWDELALMAVGLAMDACAVSVALGAAGRVHGKRAVFRLSFHFGLFQFLMPLAGWGLGRRLATYVSAVDHWIAFALLAIIGLRMLCSHDGAKEAERNDPSRGLVLVTLALATSIDAMAVGLSLAMIQVAVWYPSLVIGFVTAVLSLGGLAVGHRLGAQFGRRIEILGGFILIGIGSKVLVIHLTG